MNTLISLAAPISALIVGIPVAVIAWQQRQLARNKLRLDLFDRRYKIYDATRRFVSKILGDATFENSELFEFYANISDAEFLFGRDVVRYLEDIRKRALTLRTHQRVYEHMPVGEERTRHVNAEADELKWLTDQITAMIKTFQPYLGFSHIR